MHQFLAQCTTMPPGQGAIFAAFFMGGLTGGFTHCLAMCGPYAACSTACASKSCGLKKTASAATSLPYHLGRLTAYGALGFAAVLLSRTLASTAWWPQVSAVMLASAGVLFLLSCLRACSHDAPKASTGFGYIRGVLLGFMPCGLLYAALLTAATLPSPFTGMAAMWLFTLGTIPALLIASGGVHLLSRQWHHPLQLFGRGVMAFNGVSLLLLAAKVMR